MLWSSSLRSFLQHTVTSSLFGPNILLSILFSNTLCLCSPLNARDQVSHPYRTRGNFVVLYILIYTHTHTHIYTYPCICSSLYQPLRPSIHSSMNFYLSLYPSICTYIHPFIRLIACVTVGLSMWLNNNALLVDLVSWRTCALYNWTRSGWTPSSN
jgi:hypothetical protein